MMNAKVLTILVSTLIILLQTPTGIQKDLAKFDEAFIPVWYHTYKEELPEAVNSLSNLSHQWGEFQKKYPDYYPNDEEWPAFAGIVGERLEEVADALSEHNIELAYNQLDMVKYEMFDLRRRKKIVYSLDAWYDLHELTFEITCTANDDLLDLLEWSEFAMLVNQLDQRWEALRKGIPDHQPFAGDRVAQGKYKMARQTFDNALKNYRQALETANQVEVQKLEKALNDAAFELLVPFGNFAPFPQGL